MLSKRQFLDALLLAAPGFNEWDGHLEEWETENPLYYNVMGDLAVYLVDCYQQGKTDFFPEVFEQVEHFLKNGSPEVQNLASVGLIEDIQNVASHHSFGAKVFQQWLGPESVLQWEKINSMFESIAREKGKTQSTSYDNRGPADVAENPLIRNLIRSMVRRNRDTKDS